MLYVTTFLTIMGLQLQYLPVILDQHYVVLDKT